MILSLSGYEREVDKWKKFRKCYSLNVCEPYKSILLLGFVRTSYNSTSWGCPGMLKYTNISLSNCLYWYVTLNSCKYLKSETQLRNAQENKASAVNKWIVKTCLIVDMVRKNWPWMDVAGCGLH